MVAEGAATDRMLILACSLRKRPDDRPLPAVERYDGPSFRVLRRFLRKDSSKAPDVLILSAEHGLISHDLPIAAYDRKMTPARARKLRPLVLAELDRLTASCPPAETLVFGGKHYLSALHLDDASLPQDTTIRICTGTLGRKLAELHDWLHGAPPRLRYNSTMLVEGHSARIRGVEVSLTPEQVIQAATDALAEEWGNPQRYEAWCVPVHGQYVAPKWLVSRISGLPVGAFTTDDARRVLARLGVQVTRVGELGTTPQPGKALRPR
jgi:hypothetical protein